MVKITVLLTKCGHFIKRKRVKSLVATHQFIILDAKQVIFENKSFASVVAGVASNVAPLSVECVEAELPVHPAITTVQFVTPIRTPIPPVPQSNTPVTPTKKPVSLSTQTETVLPQGSLEMDMTEVIVPLVKTCSGLIYHYRLTLLALASLSQ